MGEFKEPKISQEIAQKINKPLDLDKEKIRVTNIDELCHSSEIVALDEKIKKLDLEESSGRGKELDLLFLRELAVNKAVGLDPETLLKRDRDATSFWKKLEAPEVMRNYSYVPDIAIIHTLLGEDLTGRTIVEVGSGDKGQVVLAYLASRGAKVIAVDVKRSDSPEFPSVEYVYGRWEDIEKHMKGRKVDVIYTHNMHPNPQARGKFENPFDGSDKKDFEKHTAEVMDKILVPGGAYVGHSIGIDYVLNYPEDFKARGYKHSRFSSNLGTRTDINWEDSAKRLEKFSKFDILKKAERAAEKVPFYDYIVVDQKPLK